MHRLPRVHLRRRWAAGAALRMLRPCSLRSARSARPLCCCRRHPGGPAFSSPGGGHDLAARLVAPTGPSPCCSPPGLQPPPSGWRRPTAAAACLRSGSTARTRSRRVREAPRRDPLICRRATAMMSGDELAAVAATARGRGLPPLSPGWRPLITLASCSPNLPA